MSKSFFGLDERNVNITCRICTIMHSITLMALAGVLLRRQFVLDQGVGEFHDVAILFSFNVIVLLGALLYFGGVTLPRIKSLPLTAIYVGFVLIGFLFTIFKYTILLDRHLSTSGMLELLFTVSAICGSLVAVYAFLAYFGKRKIDKEID